MEIHVEGKGRRRGLKKRWIARIERISVGNKGREVGDKSLWMA